MELITSQLSSDRNKLDNARQAIVEQAGANISSYRARIDQGNVHTSSPSSSSSTPRPASAATSSPSDCERDRKNPDSHPQVVQARARVDQLTKDSNGAQATYNEKTAGPKATVDAEQY